MLQIADHCMNFPSLPKEKKKYSNLSSSKVNTLLMYWILDLGIHLICHKSHWWI